MRGLALVLVAAALVLGVYHFYFEKMPASDEGTAPTEAIGLIGVRSDLLQMAKAEQNSIAFDARCASLEELLGSSTLAVPHRERDGYVYAVECSTTGFRVTARHPPAPAGSPIRYPRLAIDASLEIAEIP